MVTGHGSGLTGAAHAQPRSGPAPAVRLASLEGELADARADAEARANAETQWKFRRPDNADDQPALPDVGFPPSVTSG
jgi:hypothetical protein